MTGTGKDKMLGVIVWPTHIEYEGADAVLDNLTEAGVTAVATAPIVVEPTADPSTGRREPPDDGGEGLNRVVDRPLWGKHALYLKTSPSYQPDRSLYAGQKYGPPKTDDLTSRLGKTIGQFLEKAKARGLKTYLQLQVCHLPGMDSENSNRPAANDDLPLLPNGEPPRKRMVHFASIASDDIRCYFTAMVNDVLHAYPDVNGLLLDRAEQSFYTLGDAFVDFGSWARKKADEYGFDFEEMRSAADRVYRRLGSLSDDDLHRLQTPSDLLYETARLFRTEPGMATLLRFRAAIAGSYLKELKQAALSVSADKEIVPITFPPPMSLITGVDFKQYAGIADAVMIKFFTMHWPLIITYWSREVKDINPKLDESLLVRALSLIFGMEDSDFGASIADYAYPGPDRAHRAGTEAQVRKIRMAAADTGGKIPVLPSVHGYGPIEDVRRRFKIAWDTGSSGIWINRYGYLSDEKLTVLKKLTGK
ncbi:MAG: hypothetical protein JW852_08505 [Spirochaetales bacterium]|nr:hypothetical protein [Spirochaetales bacterium]